MFLAANAKNLVCIAQVNGIFKMTMKNILPLRMYTVNMLQYNKYSVQCSSTGNNYSKIVQPAYGYYRDDYVDNALILVTLTK